MDIEDLATEFMELATPCNGRYFSFPINQTDDYRRFEETCIQKQLSDAQSNNIDLSSNMVMLAQIDSAKRKAYDEFGKQCISQNQRCPHELKEINRLIKLFGGMYNIADPRAYVIIRAVISQSLTVLRLERYSADDGPIIVKTDKEGNNWKDVSVLEDAKRRFNESTIKAIEQLNKIFEGETTNVKVEGEISVRSLLDTIVTRKSVSQTLPKTPSKTLPDQQKDI